jgi:hypothetical protein
MLFATVLPWAAKGSPKIALTLASLRMLSFGGCKRATLLISGTPLWSNYYPPFLIMILRERARH